MPEAEYLDVILYSREQLVKEHKAMPSKGDADALPQAPWGIISIKAQDKDFETPMQVWVPAKHDLHIGSYDGCCNVHAVFEHWLQKIGMPPRMLYAISGILTGKHCHALVLAQILVSKVSSAYQSCSQPGSSALAWQLMQSDALSVCSPSQSCATL